MIVLSNNPLQLSEYCHQTSCQFDQSLYSEKVITEYEIALPEKLKTAVEKRKAEYIAGRYCASQSLKKISSRVNTNFESNEDRSPKWPEGYTGSITHSKGFASAVVAEKKHIRAIGIDSEKLIKKRTADNIHSHILTETENHTDTLWLTEDFQKYLTLVFSAKESIFKCLYPLAQQYFDFRHAKLEFNSSKPNTFSYELLKTLTSDFEKGFKGEGQYVIEGNFVHTGTVINNSHTNK
ncbi:MAG: 4'-phosphopantetheinyl transferase superfamily protein [Cellvibrionaceae bacterium]